MLKPLPKYLLAASLLVGASSASSVSAQSMQYAPQLARTGSVGPGVRPFVVREGFRVTLATNDIGNTRFIEMSGDGKTLFVSQPNRNKVLALQDKNNDGLFETQADFVTEQKSVHGMHFANGWLWFTPEGKVSKARDTNGDGKADEVVTVVEGLDKGGGHWQRAILVGDDAFFTSIGDPHNHSEPEASGNDRQKIWKYSLDGKTRTLWASGLRNTEKLRFRPGTKEIFGADHGSDDFGKLLGESKGKQPFTDLLPPCEFNRYDEGAFYGHPFITGTGMPRLEYRERPDLVELGAKSTLPVWQLGAHWAPNGWAFSTKATLGSAGSAYIANHGSWNSSRKAGYRIERIIFDNLTGLPMGAQMIVSTLSPDGNEVLARPVDCVEAPDGSMLWSCDATNRVYRISPERK
jgi:glucose/arabinose dehydrogenase